MGTQTGWTRRHFLQSSAVVVASRPVLCWASHTAVPQISVVASHAAPPAGLAYATHHLSKTGETASLFILRRQHGRWSKLKESVGQVPAAAVLSATGDFLYVAHAAAPGVGLPAGTVDAYRVAPSTGQLRLQGQQRLAMAARHPLAMALAPDHDLLAVAAHGGVFSLLPVAPDGSLQPVTAARKQIALAGEGGLLSMQFLADGQLDVVSGAATQRFTCTHQGMTLETTQAAPAQHEPARPLALLEGFPGLRCLAIV